MSLPLAARWRSWSATGDALHYRSDEERSRHRFRIFLIFFTAVHLALAAFLPLVADELYYWTWSKSLSLSYFDHPPMIAYWIRFGTAIFGDTALGVRVVSVLSASLSLWILTSIWGEGRWMILWALTPACLFGMIFSTPDLPLFFFWAAYLRWAVELARRIDTWELDPMVRAYRWQPVGFAYWGIGGLLAGLGFLSKYPMAMAPLILGAALLLRFRPKGWALGFLVHGAVAALVALPVFIFNARHGGVPLAFQWAHAGSGSPAFWKFFLGQTFLFGVVAPILLPALLIAWRRLVVDPAAAILVPMLVLPLCFFFGKATHAFLEANWPAVTYLALVPTMQRWLRVTSFPGVWRVVFFLAMVPALVGTVAATAHIVHRLPIVKPYEDRLRVAEGELNVAREGAEFIEKEKLTGQTVFAPSYQWTSTLRWYGVAAKQLPGHGRKNHFTLTDQEDPCAAESVLAWTEYSEHPPTLKCFPVRKMLHRFYAKVATETVVGQELVRFEREPTR